MRPFAKRLEEKTIFGELRVFAESSFSQTFFGVFLIKRLEEKRKNCTPSFGRTKRHFRKEAGGENNFWVFHAMSAAVTIFTKKLEENLFFYLQKGPQKRCQGKRYEAGLPSERPSNELPSQEI